MVKVKMNYKKITIQQMVDYVLKYDNTQEAKDMLNSFVTEEPKNTKLVPVFDEEGNAVMYTNKKGERKQKMKRVAVGKETRQGYKILESKKAFYNRYSDKIEFENPPIKTKEVENDKIKKALAMLNEN